MTVPRPPLELYQLIESLSGNGEAQRRLREDPVAMFEAFNLPEEQRTALRKDPKAALEAIGAHPNMQFKFLAALGLLPLKAASVRDYLTQAKARRGSHR